MLSLSRRQVVSKQQQQQCAMIPVCEESSAMMFLFMFCSTTRGGEDCRACLWTDGEWGTEQLLLPYPPLSIGADDSWLESVLSFACKPLCSRYSPICRITVQSMMHFTRRRKMQCNEQLLNASPLYACIFFCGTTCSHWSSVSLLARSSSSE